MQTRRLSGGFSLVEMTIVFVIMSLVITVGVSALTTQYETVRLSTTRKHQEIIQQSLTNFIARNGRLPCPAVRGIAPGAAGYGVEAGTPGTCTGTATSGTGLPTVATGIVPFVSMGLNDDMASDGYFNRFTYQVVVSATTAVSSVSGPGIVQMPAGIRGYITVHSGSPTTSGLAPAGNQTNYCQLGNYNPCAAVAVILSHGKNGLGAFTPSGTRLPMPASADELANADDDGAFVRRDKTEGGPNHFDDLLFALTPNDLLDQLTRNGTVKDARAVLNATFDTMLGATVSRAITNPTTVGTPPAKCYAISFPTTPFYDTWGNPISLPSGFAITSPICASSPSGINAIAFSSSGPDGTGGSTTDDIARSISVGELQQYLAKSGF